MIKGNYCSVCDGEEACNEVDANVDEQKKCHKDKLALLLFLIVIPLFAIIFFDLIRSI